MSSKVCFDLKLRIFWIGKVRVARVISIIGYRFNTGETAEVLIIVSVHGNDGWDISSPSNDSIVGSLFVLKAWT